MPRGRKGRLTVASARTRTPTPQELRKLRQAPVANQLRALGGGERVALLEQLEGLKVSRCVAQYKMATDGAGPSDPGVGFVFNLQRRMSIGTYQRHKAGPQPVPADQVCRIRGRAVEEKNAWERVGWEMIAKGTVAVVTLAGGDGTRLGARGPKGCFDIGLPSGKSLFQLQAERIKRLQELAAEKVFPELGGEVKHTLRWYVMTSPSTHAPTKRFFLVNRFFGLDPFGVKFFQQESLPAFSQEGKMLMKSYHEVATAGNGNGGLYAAMACCGVYADMKARGIVAFDCVSIDNALTKFCEPTFLGFCKKRGAEVGCRTIAKRFPDEKVGVFAEVNGKLRVTEYTELDPKEAEAEDEVTGLLKFNWANLCLQYFTVKYAESVAGHIVKQPLHVAKKRIMTVDGWKMATKLESFIFDPWPRARNLVLFEVRRHEEFAPVKNADTEGAEDTPATAKRAVMRLHAAWLKDAGAILKNVKNVGPKLVEISPLISLHGENLTQFMGRTFHTDDHVERLEPEKHHSAGEDSSDEEWEPRQGRFSLLGRMSLPRMSMPRMSVPFIPPPRTYPRPVRIALGVAAAAAVPVLALLTGRQRKKEKGEAKGVAARKGLVGLAWPRRGA